MTKAPLVLCRCHWVWPGPLLVHGTHASGTFYVPLATTEGALVRSYERGMVTLSRAGGLLPGCAWTKIVSRRSSACRTWVLHTTLCGISQKFRRRSAPKRSPPRVTANSCVSNAIPSGAR